MSLIFWSLWGFLGAFVYAAPRLIVAWSEARAAAKPFGMRVAEFVIALTFGPIFAAGFGPFAAHYLGREADQEVRALALVIGMVANPAAPLLVRLVTGDILRRIGAAKGESARD